MGLRAIGVSPSGAADRGAMARANALVGNRAGTAVLEATFGGLVLRALGPAVVAITGARCGDAVPMDETVRLRRGDTIALDGARQGMRAYVAIAGGVDVPAVLGSLSRDTLSGIGPAPLVNGQGLRTGDAASTAPEAAAAAPPLPGPSVDLAVTAGPRTGWVPPAALEEAEGWEVSPDSNRVAVRLRGRHLPVRAGSIEPEPLVRGAVQVPPDGLPIVFLADHPVTGGYPVVAVLTAAACDLLAQCRPGTHVRLVRSADGDDPRAALAPW